VRVIRALYESLDKREPVRVKIEQPEKPPSSHRKLERGLINFRQRKHAKFSGCG
jgi:hypothetical protein